MLTSSRIIASLVVFTTAAVANAQDYRGFYTPVQTQYGVTQTNYQPFNSSRPCLTGNCPQTTSYPYVSTTNYGYNQACANGMCNHPQHQLSQACLNGYCNHPQHQTFSSLNSNCLNGQCGTCLNGQCGIGQFGNCSTGQCGVSQSPNYQMYNGSTTIPFRQPYPANYGTTRPSYGNSPYQLNVSTVPNNSVTTRPVYGTPSYRPASSSPYYN